VVIISFCWKKKKESEVSRESSGGGNLEKKEDCLHKFLRDEGKVYKEPLIKRSHEIPEFDSAGKNPGLQRKEGNAQLQGKRKKGVVLLTTRSREGGKQCPGGKESRPTIPFLKRKKKRGRNVSRMLVVQQKEKESGYWGREMNR